MVGHQPINFGSGVFLPVVVKATKDVGQQQSYILDHSIIQMTCIPFIQSCARIMPV
jgi:hypothetical protein